MMALVAVSIATSAWADSSLAPADSSRVYDLDEVVVVSQSKEYAKLRQQPLSSTVLTGNEIGSLGVRDLREISDFVPSFVMPNYGARFTSSIYVRGIGSRVNSPSMGIYVDDIPLMNKSAFNSHTWQLDRVDVLRGPQGTLYGVNTEGGLVRQYTKNPLRYQGTDIKLGIGTHFYRNAEVAHYQKLSEKLAMSVAAFYNGTNGFWKNTLTGERTDDMNEAGGRLRLVYQPTKKLSFDWMADYQYVRQHAYPYGVLEPESGKVISEPDQDSQGKYKRNMFNTGLAIKYQGRGFDFHSNTSYQLLKDNLLMDNDYSSIDFIVVDQSQLSNALTQEFTFKSNNQSRWHWTTGVFGSYQWLKTTAPNTFGSYFSNMMKKTMRLDQAEAGIYNSILASMSSRMPEEAAKAAIEKAGGVNIGVQMLVPCLFHTPQANLAIFHESNIDLSNHLVATLGLRYDYTHSKIEYDTKGDFRLIFSIMGQDVSARVLSLYQHSEKTSFSQLLPKFGLTYKFNDGSNIYATVTKGYRAGGFNVQMFGDIVQNDIQANASVIMKAAQDAQTTKQNVEEIITQDDAKYAALLEGIRFKPEESWNYEVGTHLNLFGSKVHADLSAYYMKIRNQQLSVFTEDYGYGRKMVNAGKSYSCGVELSLRGSAADNHLNWSLGYGYTHAVFKEYKNRASAKAAEVDYKDNKVPFVPAHTLSAQVDYRFDFEDACVKNLTIGANMNAQGKIWWDEANTYAQKFYAVLGAHVSADFGACSLNLWARNLTDSQYNTFAFSSKATGKEVYMAQRGNPFQLGMDLAIHF
ncbi:Outer membrane receptor proteins, mostly Fe transport [Prevotellaceae bacterium MN60]|nr:Outer membrane receptor proteins, mostly Fe transport [Prevotellaceae bacterium MN60]